MVAQRRASTYKLAADGERVGELRLPCARLAVDHRHLLRRDSPAEYRGHIGATRADPNALPVRSLQKSEAGGGGKEGEGKEGEGESERLWRQ